MTVPIPELSLQADLGDQQVSGAPQSVALGGDFIFNGNKANSGGNLSRKAMFVAGALALGGIGWFVWNK